MGAGGRRRRRGVQILPRNPAMLPRLRLVEMDSFLDWVAKFPFHASHLRKFHEKDITHLCCSTSSKMMPKKFQYYFEGINENFP